ncbi:ABC transporter substrate-binding protein [Phytohabitans kaempferiae]|uniref:ABC transporter substrate-binding protein n=1 Tax=Phytohabitans kaempferiae TaxID=1620943 RepID=A0ABV6LYJ2_9ACTN
MGRRTRSSIAAVAASLVVASAAACGDSAEGTGSGEPATGLPPALQQLYDAARQEGTVTYWTSDDPPVIAKVMESFSKTYPGIKVEPVLIQPEEAVEKIISETVSGNAPSADLAMIGVPSAVPLLDRDLAEKVDWAQYGAPADDAMFDGRGLRFLNYTLAIAYNPEKIKRQEVPTTLEGLADSTRLNDGRLVLESRGWAFGLMASSIGQDQSLALLDRLLTKKPLVIKGAGPVGQAVASGEADVGFTLLTSSAMEMKEAGASVDYVVPNPILCTNFQNVVLKNAKSPNAAKLLSVWLNSPESMEAYKGQNLFPERLTGPWIPAYSKEMLDTGAPILCDDDKNVALGVDTNTKAASKMAGLG